MIGAGTVRDPVCQMDIEPEDAVAKSEHKGKTYYFCAEVCKQTFEKNPEKYAKEIESPKRTM